MFVGGTGVKVATGPATHAENMESETTKVMLALSPAQVLLS